MEVRAVIMVYFLTFKSDFNIFYTLLCHSFRDFRKNKLNFAIIITNY